MKIAWVCNEPTQKYKEMHGMEGDGASWIESVYVRIVKKMDVELSVIFPQTQKCEDIYEKIEGVSYYVIKSDENYKVAKEHIINSYAVVLNKVSPDIIHVWGTEFPQVLFCVDAAKQLGMSDRVVIHLQGLCAAIAEHYFAGMPEKTVKGYTFRDFIKRDNLYEQKNKFSQRSKYELHALQSVKYVIGRTDYDRAYATIVNPKLNYLHCNEIIRDSFGEQRWKYDECKKYSIFISQAYYPLKGLHFVLKAVSLIKNRYPLIEINIAGSDIVRQDEKFGSVKRNSYARYISKMIRKYDLVESVHFVGNQPEREMIQWYLRSNVFISASSTENESNSLGEAKMLGMPVIASFVGGVSNRINHKEDGLAYQYDDVVILARYISDIFDNPQLATQYGVKARENEKLISNPRKNYYRLLEIYRYIMEENGKE